MADLLKFQTKLGHYQDRTNWYIMGKVSSELGTRRVRVSTDTTDLKTAEEIHTNWQERERADYRERQRKEVLRASGYNEDDGRLTITVTRAAEIYERQRNAKGKPFKSQCKNDVQKWVDAHGDRLIYNITPDIAYQLALEMFPNRPGRQKRSGTSLISALYNSVARVHTGFEKRTWIHERKTGKQRDHADRDWINQFLALADAWTGMPTKFQVDHRCYQLDPEDYKYMVITATVFLFTTATRITEAGSIKWKHVDFDRRVISVPGQNRKIEKDHDKMLTPDMAASLRYLYSVVPNKPEHYVFPYIGEKSASKNFNRTVDRISSGKLPRLTSHEIGSHGCISILIDEGLTDREISEITGKSVETIKIYGAATRTVKAKKVDGVFGGIATKPVPNVCPNSAQSDSLCA